jgi:hypothetical protein
LRIYWYNRSRGKIGACYGGMYESYKLGFAAISHSESMRISLPVLLNHDHVVAPLDALLIIPQKEEWYFVDSTGILISPAIAWARKLTRPTSI